MKGKRLYRVYDRIGQHIADCWEYTAAYAIIKAYGEGAYITERNKIIQMHHAEN